MKRRLVIGLELLAAGAASAMAAPTEMKLTTRYLLLPISNGVGSVGAFSKRRQGQAGFPGCARIERKRVRHDGTTIVEG